MKSFYYGIDKDGNKDISEDKANFQICRQVIGCDNTLDHKEQRLKDIPYCSMLNSLEIELKNRVNTLLDEGDDGCMTDISGFNEE